ncbi:MAG: histidine phosphatase family protein [Candidatus Moranbacteria bacterium]|nr:histidine phosphatase family protein [Candidatus Moranbacteria bacterium]
MKLIITSHGETVENSKRIVQGHLGGRLSKIGKQQAKKVARRLKKEKLGAIYSSDLKRAVDTANEIAKFHKDLTVQFDKRLRERFFGKYQGKTYSENWDWKSIPEGIESDSKMNERVTNFIDDILDKHKNDTVLIVSHGGIKKIIYEQKLPPEKIEAIEKIGNTSITIFEIDKNGNFLPILVNDTTHLEINN